MGNPKRKCWKVADPEVIAWESKGLKVNKTEAKGVQGFYGRNPSFSLTIAISFLQHNIAGYFAFLTLHKLKTTHIVFKIQP